MATLYGDCYLASDEENIDVTLFRRKAHENLEKIA